MKIFVTYDFVAKELNPNDSFEELDNFDRFNCMYDGNINNHLHNSLRFRFCLRFSFYKYRFSSLYVIDTDEPRKWASI